MSSSAPSKSKKRSSSTGRPSSSSASKPSKSGSKGSKKEDKGAKGEREEALVGGLSEGQAENLRIVKKKRTEAAKARRAQKEEERQKRHDARKAEKKKRKERGLPSADEDGDGDGAEEGPSAKRRKLGTTDDKAYKRNLMRINRMGNKIVRAERRAKVMGEMKRARAKARRERQKLHEENPEANPKAVPLTVERMRVEDETVVKAFDDEVVNDQAIDKLAGYFAGEAAPRLLITTNDYPTVRTKKLILELGRVFKNSEYYPRRGYKLKQIIKWAAKRGFTNMMVFHEWNKEPVGMVMIHLPGGPTAHFRLTSLKLREEIKGSCKPSSHDPELVLGNFTTRLGHTVGRLLATLIHQAPDFKGRRVVTFHNQRDYIFFRHHIYQFSSSKNVALRECGPRFTLKLKSLQEGTFDTAHGEYEWIEKPENDTVKNKLKFVL